ncbi:MAG: PEP-utilizing enzyme [Patescibacteria group bacterium]
MSAVAHFGKWRIKPSGQLPIFLRFMINSSFTAATAKAAKIKTVLKNRTYLNHMMYWKATEYNKFEAEIINHLKKNDGWFESYCQREMRKAEKLYQKGSKFKRTDWAAKSDEEIKAVLKDLLEEYRYITSPWYAQYALDEYFEHTIEEQLEKYISPTDPLLRHYVLIFTDPQAATEVSQERYGLTLLLQRFIVRKENLDKLSAKAKEEINKHLDKYAYINRGLATSKPYSFQDIINRLKEMKKLIKDGQTVRSMIYNASAQKIKDDYQKVLKRVKPDKKFKEIIIKARRHSYMRNRRVEAFFKADYGASFMYAEIARRSHFNPDWIMEITTEEMFGALSGKKLPNISEMKRRFANYAMVVRNSQTKLISDPREIKKMEKQYFVDAVPVEEIMGRVACLGGIIKGKAKICLDKKEISKVKKGDILVAQFTTPDFVPAMEKAAAIIADQGGVSSHAAIVSRELGVPCVIDTKNATRIIKDNDLVEVNAKTGLIKVLKRYGK